MMAQVPMLPLTSWIKRASKGTAFDQAGNYIFWTTFCFIGQPMSVLMYYAWAE